MSPADLVASTSLSVLMVSLDDTLLGNRAAVRGDAQDRMLHYAERVARLTCVVYARRVKRLAARRLAPNLHVVPTDSAARLLLPFDAWRRADRLAREARPDVVTTQDPFTTGLVGLALRRRHGVPLNVQVFTSFLDNPHWRSGGIVNRVMAPIGRAVLRHADTVRVESDRERARVLGLGIAPERVWVIPVAVDVSRFVEADGREVRARLLGRGDRLVVYVGRLAPEKDVGTLLGAMKTVVERRDGTRLAIVGDGPEAARLRRLAADLGLAEHVVFTGRVGFDDLPAHFAACDVFVLPSLYEGVPTVLVEAALAGRPVVSTATPNVADVVEDGRTGHVVPQRNPETLAERILELVGDPSRAAAMGRAGRAHLLGRYDAATIYGQVVAMWQATARSRG